MKKIFFAAAMMSLMLAMTGCGDGGGSVVVAPTPVVVTSILSNQTFDGDILNGITVSPLNSPSVFAGINPVTGSEFRAFLVFPLTGAGGVPGGAFIDSATLDIFIDSIAILPAASSIPIRIELVSYPPQTLQPLHYDRNFLPPLASTTIPIFRTDDLRHVTVDVTSLMAEAQNRGLLNFQIRILEDFGIVSPGLIEIDDTTINRAPLLTVTYH